MVVGIAALACGLAQTPPPGRSARHIYVSRSGGSYLGVGVAEIDAERAKALNMKEARGVEITNVDEDSPADKAGIKKGDVVLEYNGQRIEGTEQFVRVVHETPVDRQVRLVVWRGGSSQTLTAAIGHRGGTYVHSEDDGDVTVEIPPMPEMPPMPEIPVMPSVPDFSHLWGSGHRALLGVETEALQSQLAAYFGVKEGVLVRSVARNSAAEKSGMRAGDVITKVDGEAVTSTQDLVNALSRVARAKKPFPIVVVRDRKEMTLTVTLETGGGGGTRGGHEIGMPEEFC